MAATWTLHKSSHPLTARSAFVVEALGRCGASLPFSFNASVSSRSRVDASILNSFDLGAFMLRFPIAHNSICRKPSGQRCLKFFSVFLIEGALIDRMQMRDNEVRILTS